LSDCLPNPGVSGAGLAKLKSGPIGKRLLDFKKRASQFASPFGLRHAALGDGDFEIITNASAYCAGDILDFEVSVGKVCHCVAM
jgi:hypothetical protein